MLNNSVKNIIIWISWLVFYRQVTRTWIRKYNIKKVLLTISGKSRLGRGMTSKSGKMTTELCSSNSNFFFPASGLNPPSTPIARRAIFFSGSVSFSTGI